MRHFFRILLLIATINSPLLYAVCDDCESQQKLGAARLCPECEDAAMQQKFEASLDELDDFLKKKSQHFIDDRCGNYEIDNTLKDIVSITQADINYHGRSRGLYGEVIFF